MNNNYESSIDLRTTRKVINKEVSVTSVYFRPGRHLKGFPKRMEYEGREYTFVESGLRYLVQKGQQLFEIFDMTDGTQDYRLKFDTGSNIWTLMAVKVGARVGSTLLASENNYVLA